MSDLIPDTRDLRRDGDLNAMKQYFNEGSRLEWKEPEIKELIELYEIACKEDNEDPVRWVQSFDQSYPRKLDVGLPTQKRLGKILHMAKVYLDRKVKRDEANPRKERNF